MKNIRIGSRLSAAFGLVLFLMISVSGYSLVRMSEIQDRLNTIVNVNDVKQSLVTAMFTAVGDQALSLRNLVLVGDPDAVKAEVARLAQTRQQYDDAKRSLMQLLTTTGDENASEQKLLAAVAASEAAARGIFLQIENLGAAHNNEQAVAIMFGDSRATLKSWRQSLSDLVKYESDQNLVAVERVDRAYKNTRNTTIVIVSAALLLSLVITRLMTRSITRPLNTAVGIAQQVAGGDLTARIDPASLDETGQMIRALKEMNASLSNIVGQVRTGAELIGSASSQIATGNLDLSSRTEEQAGSLQQTAAAMEELTSTVRENSSHTQRASQLALSASEAAASGGALVGQVVGTMEDINVSSQKISGIVNVIDTIAFQTNMLALNASVEAARAGEQGRGFAVVAAEVRALAQHSAAAAKEIKSLIGASAEKMSVASKLVTDAGLTMDDIIARIRNVADVVGEIAVAGEKQSAGIEQVNAAIAQMDGTTQQNAALVEEAAAASQSLQEQAMALTQLVSVFKLGDLLLPAEPHSHLIRAEPARLTASPSAAGNERARIGFN